MAKLTPQEFADKHNRRLKAAIPDMAAGIARVSEAPTAKAAAKQEKMKTRLIAKIDDGTWASRLKAVDLASWKLDMTEKGVPRIAGGIDRAEGKVRDFATQFLPFADAVQAKVSKMPDITLEDNINRATTAIRELSKFKKK